MPLDMIEVEEKNQETELKTQSNNNDNEIKSPLPDSKKREDNDIADLKTGTHASEFNTAAHLVENKK